MTTVSPTKGVLALDEARADILTDQLYENVRTDPKLRFDELASYMLHLWKYRVLRDQERFNELYREYSKGSMESRDLIIYGNIRLVVSIAMRRTGRGLPLADLLQEGVLGLMTALEKFNPEYGHRFSTYATWWIRQTIDRAICDQTDRFAFRLPNHIHVKLRLTQRAINLFWREHGRWPSAYEVFDTVRSFGSKQATDYHLRDAVRCMRISAQGALSLDWEYEGNDGQKGETLGDLVENPKAKTETIVEARRLLLEVTRAIERVIQAIDQLAPREAMVLRLRFGMGEFDRLTLEDVGERYELSRERIRQIETAAIERLQRHGVTITAEQMHKLCAMRDELAKIAHAV